MKAEWLLGIHVAVVHAFPRPPASALISGFVMMACQLGSNEMSSECLCTVFVCSLHTRGRGVSLLSAIHTGRVSRFAQICANPLMLLAACVNTPIYCSMFHNLHACVARCSASCVNGAQKSSAAHALLSDYSTWLPIPSAKTS